MDNEDDQNAENQSYISGYIHSLSIGKIKIHEELVISEKSLSFVENKKNNKFHRSQINPENFNKDLQKFDYRTISQSQKLIKLMHSYIALSFISLLSSFIICCYIQNKINFFQVNNLVDNAQQIILDFRQQQLLQGFKNVSNSNITKFPMNFGCPDDWKTVKLGSYSGTSKGCICPTLQTSTQMCQDPCKIVNESPSIPYYQFDGQQICGLRANVNQTSLNKINLVEESQADKPNVLKMGEQFFHFTNKEIDLNYMQFYTFAVSPSPPCVNPTMAPHLKSHLSYPFAIKAFTGCDAFGDKSEQVFLLGTTKQHKLFEDNNVTIRTNNQPYFSTYNNDEEPYNIYAVRKWYMNENKICKLVFTYPFDSMQYSCLLVQLALQMMNYFSFIYFFFGLCFAIYYGYVFLLSWMYYEANIKHTQWKLLELCIRSLITLAVLLFVQVFITEILILYGIYNENGLNNSQVVLQTFLDIPCFKNKPMTEALQHLNSVSQTCSSSVEQYFFYLLWSQLACFVCFVSVVTWNRMKKQKLRDQ